MASQIDFYSQLPISAIVNKKTNLACHDCPQCFCTSEFGVFRFCSGVGMAAAVSGNWMEHVQWM